MIPLPRKIVPFKYNLLLTISGSERGLSFQTSGSEAAILTMPEGAISEDLENISRFRKYAAANARRWYEYINGPRGREAKNGDVRLVVGCDKTTSWGMAVLPSTNRRCQLKFKPLDRQMSDSPSQYTWEYSGTAVVSIGPDKQTIDELKDEDTYGPTTREKYLNQCLFVRTFNVTLNNNDWEILNRPSKEQVRSLCSIFKMKC